MLIVLNLVDKAISFYKKNNVSYTSLLFFFIILNFCVPTKIS